MYSKTTVMPGGHVMVALCGEIDICTARAVRGVLAEAAGEAVAGVIVDLAGVRFVDAAGLRVLADTPVRARHLPDGLRLVAVPARLLRLLRLTGLDRQLAAYPAPPRSRPQRERAARLPAATGSPAEAAAT